MSIWVRKICFKTFIYLYFFTYHFDSTTWNNKTQKKWRKKRKKVINKSILKKGRKGRERAWWLMSDWRKEEKEKEQCLRVNYFQLFYFGAMFCFHCPQTFLLTTNKQFNSIKFNYCLKYINVTYNLFCYA